ncbi:hypothetical protein [Kitasatospora phosalacinea]|uniref:Uncharacterized protein n=1 Tax=Kitasatospora phosalacinea TaxID=2065 RepID=A0A9W6USZ8_9ACTN|nr:hypothetical protein [Kitasatospora phosalacinea]GLW58080.1 hypothetical protein Kpho01_60910 [Kitasatospora phosalacinea]
MTATTDAVAAADGRPDTVAATGAADGTTVLPAARPAPVPAYAWFGEVPEHLLTRTQFDRLDLPRRPGGPHRATVAGSTPAGKDTFRLYDLAESLPTAATGAQLAAAAARSSTARTCEECGARPDTPPTAWSDAQGYRSRLMCRTCLQIDKARQAQQQARVDSAAAARELADLVAERAEQLVALDVAYTLRATPSGKPVPAAATLTALDLFGTPLFRRTLRLTGPRTKGAPDHAVPAADALDELSGILAGRTVLMWDLDDLDALRRAAIDAPAYLPRRRRCRSLHQLVTRWRADVGADARLRPAIAPGTADRLLHLVHLAAGTTAARRPGEAALPGL